MLGMVTRLENEVASFFARTTAQGPYQSVDDIAAVIQVELEPLKDALRATLAVLDGRIAERKARTRPH
jgi:hypothetical protein